MAMATASPPPTSPPSPPLHSPPPRPHRLSCGRNEAPRGMTLAISMMSGMMSEMSGMMSGAKPPTLEVTQPRRMVEAPCGVTSARYVTSGTPPTLEVPQPCGMEAPPALEVPPLPPPVGSTEVGREGFLRRSRRIAERNILTSFAGVGERMSSALATVSQPSPSSLTQPKPPPSPSPPSCMLVGPGRGRANHGSGDQGLRGRGGPRGPRGPRGQREAGGAKQAGQGGRSRIMRIRGGSRDPPLRARNPYARGRGRGRGDRGRIGPRIPEAHLGNRGRGRGHHQEGMPNTWEGSLGRVRNPYGRGGTMGKGTG